MEQKETESTEILWEGKIKLITIDNKDPDAKYNYILRLDDTEFEIDKFLEEVSHLETFENNQGMSNTLLYSLIASLEIFKTELVNESLYGEHEKDCDACRGK